MRLADPPSVTYIYASAPNLVTALLQDKKNASLYIVVIHPSSLFSSISSLPISCENEKNKNLISENKRVVFAQSRSSNLSNKAVITTDSAVGNEVTNITTTHESSSYVARRFPSSSPHSAFATSSSYCTLKSTYVACCINPVLYVSLCSISSQPNPSSVSLLRD